MSNTVPNLSNANMLFFVVNVQKAEYGNLHLSSILTLDIVKMFTSNSTMNFQFGQHNETLSIALHLIHLKKKEGPLPFSGLVISFLVFLLIILETLGNFLLLCIICYEKHGMDSKKRTVTNMLLSRNIFILILFNIFIMPLPAIGQIFGVFSEYTLHGLLYILDCANKDLG